MCIRGKEKSTEYGILNNISTYNVFHIFFDEFGNMVHDVKKAPGWKAKMSYIFKAPGWKHDGKDERISTLQNDWKKKTDA